MSKKVEVKDAQKEKRNATRRLNTVVKGKSARPELVVAQPERVEVLLTSVNKLIHVINQERWERQQAALKASLTINKPSYVKRVLNAVRGL